MGLEHYYRDGSLIEDDELMPAWEKWALLFEMRKYRVVKHSRTLYGELLSTVWLGLEHGYDNGRPLLFETMLFAPESEGDERIQLRYTNEEDARERHYEILMQCLVPPRWRHFVLGTVFDVGTWKRWDDEEELW